MSSAPAGPTSVREIVEAILDGPPGHRLLLFDFDGTLREFTPVPSEADLPDHRRELLIALERRPDATVGIVSGRRIEDVRDRTGLDHIIYSGLHGLEIEAPGETFLHEVADEARALVPDLARALATAAEGLAGVVVEDKGLSVALHWRMASPAAQAEAQRRLDAALAAAVQEGRLRLQRGSAVCEVLPRVEWDKGDAIRWIRDHVARRRGGPVWPLFVGDDLTDEDGFAAVGEDGVTVVVGSQPSRARFRLADPGAVEDLLRALLAAPQLRRG